MKNDPLMPLSFPNHPPPKTRASEKFEGNNRANKDVFIGIAMSVGESRATSFL
jgi:hypothetical protein